MMSSPLSGLAEPPALQGINLRAVDSAVSPLNPSSPRVVINTVSEVGRSTLGDGEASFSPHYAEWRALDGS